MIFTIFGFIMVCMFPVVNLMSSSEVFQLLFNRSDWYCPVTCDSYIEESAIASCCVCNVEVKEKTMSTLNIVYDEVSEEAIINEPNVSHEFYKIQHKFDGVQKLPINLCNFTGIVEIDFSFNEIGNIDIISCVKGLEILSMYRNKIKYLKNDTFFGMNFLRYVDLSHNILKYIEPGLFMNMDGSLLWFDASYNLLTSMDVTNILRTKQPGFCRADFSFNQISKLTNELRWECKEDTQFGNGGLVDFFGNSFSDFFDFSELGFKNFFLFGKLLYYTFDFRGNKWTCDCRFYPFALKATLFAEKLDRDIYYLKCHSPSELKNVSLPELMKSKTLDLLICNLSIADRCPPNCRCFYQPARTRTVVNCSGTEKTKLPSALPFKTDLEVDFSNNQISRIDNESVILSYSHTITSIDLSYNKIENLPDELFYKLRNTKKINFSGNKMKKIPRALQALKPCQIYLGLIVLECKCEDTWIQNWLPSSHSKCYNNTRMFCYNKNELVNILSMTNADLGCKFYSEYILWLTISLAVIVFILAVSSTIIFYFRFEIFIMSRKLMKYLQTSEVRLELYTYDVYISCSEDDANLRRWLTSTLVPFLENENLRVFLPFRDSEFGHPREEGIIETMTKSLNFVIILSEHYDDYSETWIEKEWKYAWFNYKSDSQREIVIINYDMLEYKDIAKKYLGAFLKLHSFIDFSNHTKRINEEVYNSLQHVHKTVRKKSNKSNYHNSFKNNVIELETIMESNIKLKHHIKNCSSSEL